MEQPTIFRGATMDRNVDVQGRHNSLLQLDPLDANSVQINGFYAQRSHAHDNDNVRIRRNHNTYGMEMQ